MATRKRRGSDTERAPSPEPEPLPVPPPVVHVAPLTPEFPIDPDEPSPLGDILMVDGAKMKVLAAKGQDTTIARVRVERHSEKEGRFIRQDGEYPPDLVTASWLRKKWGPGRYYCRGVNAGGMYLASGHVTVEALPEQAGTALAPMVLPSPAHGVAQGLTFEQQLVLTLLQGRGAAAPVQDDGLRETLSAMSRMIALQVQTATMNQVKSQLAGPAPANGHEDKFLELLKVLVLNGGAPKRESSSFGLKELLPVLHLGIGLGTRASGAPVKENPELPPWLQVMPDLADTLGVPLIATIAQATLPPDKAEAVLAAISEHQKARVAEAKASAAEEEPEE